MIKLAYHSQNEVNYMKEMNETNRYPSYLAETIGLYVLHSAIRDIPYDFTKDDPPDWYYKNEIGLEMARAFEDKDWEQIVNIPIVKLRLKDLVTKDNIKYPGRVLFHSKSVKDCPILTYDIQKRTITYGTPPVTCHYDDLNSDVKAKIGECQACIHRSGENEIDNPYIYCELVATQFVHKLEQLNSKNRKKFEKEWLFIEILPYSDLRGLKPLFLWMIDKQKTFRRRFDTIFLLFDTQGSSFTSSQLTLVSANLSERIYTINYLHSFDSSVVDVINKYKPKKGDNFRDIFDSVPSLCV